MTEFISRLRRLESFETAILSGVTLDRAERSVDINVITDRTFSAEDENKARNIARSFVPEEFSCNLRISKLTPDTAMVSRKIMQTLSVTNKALSALVTEDDIVVERTENGFFFTISVITNTNSYDDVVKKLIDSLSRSFCGEFAGRCVKSEKMVENLEIEEEHENIEYELPIRTFGIENFSFLEGSAMQNSAVYMSDLNFASENVTVCGEIVDISERTYNRKKDGAEKTYYSITLSDTTATLRATYFTRMKSIEKIKKLKAGDSIVCTGKTELYNGTVRFTAKEIDYGTMPKGFVPEKRPSKPAPQYYNTVFPAEFKDYTQTDLFTERIIPDCLKDNTFVVFDLETTGLNSSPSAGNMDRIIEIGAYKIIDGEIKESFNTFINPERKLSEEIIALTGITPDMLEGAPTYEKVMPDFFKFCQGSYLVGHNIAGFDFRFVDYYCSRLGYNLERRIFDTLSLSQELLFLSNYKLNTVADHFGITFNHHRAADDALVTAKIFIELIKLKKSLPKLC
ncbi:MAG: exonuclease domain-containing protein [Candidatus Coproplasma sp.]